MIFVAFFGCLGAAQSGFLMSSQTMVLEFGARTTWPCAGAVVDGPGRRCRPSGRWRAGVIAVSFGYELLFRGLHRLLIRRPGGLAGFVEEPASGATSPANAAAVLWGARQATSRRANIHAHRRPQGNQDPRIPGSAPRRGWCSASAARVIRCSSRPGPGRGSAWATRAYRDVGAESPAGRRRGVRGGRNDRQGQGAAGHRRSPGSSRAHILFTYLHLAADPEQARGLMASGCTAIAYGDDLRSPRASAAAGPDEPGRRADGGGRRRLSSAEGRPAAAACCWAACRACPPAKVLILGGGGERQARRADGHRPPRRRDSVRHLRRPGWRNSTTSSAAN